MVKELAQAWYDVSKALTQSDIMMNSLHKSISAIGTGLGILIKLMPVLIRLGLWLGATFGFKAAIMGVGSLVTGFRTLYTSIVATNGAMGVMNTLMKSNAFLFAASAIATAVTLLWDYGKAAEEAAKRETERQAKLKAAYEKSREAVENSVKPLESYKRALDEANLSEQQKMQLVKDFKSSYQDYLDYLGIEVNTALDLAKAYGLVVKVMKQKKAYEERENYRTEVNGQNRMDRIEAQAKTESEARSLGIEGIDKSYLENTQNVRRGGYIVQRGSDAIVLDILRKKYGDNIGMSAKGQVYRIETVDKNAPKSASNQRIVNIDVDVSGLRKAVSSYVSSYRTETKTNREINNMFNAEYKDIDLEHFDLEDFNQKVQAARWKRKGTLDREAPDKEALKAAKKAAQEAKKAAREEMKDAQAASTGIISKLEEYYRLQETAINEARADGELTEDRAKELVRSLNVLKNESLATARRAITTGETEEWDKMKQTLLPTVLADATDQSKQLLNTIQNVQVDVLHKNLSKFNGTDKVFGLDSRAFFDQMNAKAAGNQREAARLRAKIQNEIEKALLQYQFVEKANQKMRKDLETMGFITESYEQFAERMRQGITEKPDTLIGLPTSQRNAVLDNYMERYSGVVPVSDTENAEQLKQWLSDFTEGGKAEWAIGLPSISDWLKDANSHLPEIKQFYDTLRDYQLRAERQMEEPLTEESDRNLTELLGRRISDEQAYRQMGNKFIDQGVINFEYNIDNEEEAMQWIKQFATTAKGELEDWAYAFPELLKWIELIKRKESGETLGDAELQSLQNAMPQIQNLFNEMMNHADRINKAMKDAFQYEKTQMENRFRVSGYKDQEEQTDKYYANKQKQEQTGAGQTFVQQIGLGSIANDPEILQIQNRIYWRNKEVEDARARLDAMKAIQDQEIENLRENYASEEEIHALELQHAQDRAGLEQLLSDRQAALTEQTTKLTTKTMQELQKRVTAVEKLAKPFTDAANNIGKKFGEMIRNAEEDSMTWNEIWHNMLLAVGESVIEMGAQYAQNLIMQQAMNRASEAETAAHTTADVTAGIASGSAKTIGTLGWWGIPLVAGISALLMGLLQGALSTNRSTSESSTSTKETKINTKLVSGMLTYDKGNVSQIAESGGIFSGRRKIYDDGTTQVYEPMNRTSGRHPVVGQDGQVYMVHDEPELRTGIIRRPTATTVNGEPAIVGEKGPEIVIGRKTSAAIQKNAPELLQAIADIDRNPNHRPALPVYDKGNVQESVVREMMDNFHKTHTVNNTENTESMTRWFNDFVTTAVIDENGMPKRQPAAFIKAMPQMGQWLEQPENYIQEITQLYTILSNHEDVEKRDMQEKTERTNSVSEQLQTVVDIDRNPNHKPSLPVYDKGNVQVLHSKDIGNQNVDIMAENVKKLGPFHSDFIDACKKVNKKESEFTIFKRVAYTPHESPQNTGMLYRVYEILEQKGVVPLISGMNYSQKEISQNDNNVVNSLPAGVNIITEPIATMVNGEPSLVAEKGPEIVIGRETSKAIMMNEPELLQRIVKYDKHGGRAGLTAMRAFDQGNVSTVVPDEVGDVAQPVATPDAPVTSDNSDLRQTMQEMQQVMQGVLYYLKHPVSPEIAMYGENGLHKKMKQADKFMSKYEG